MNTELGSAPALELTPHEPPLMFPESAAVDAQIGAQPEDFVVDEIPLYPHSGAGEHLYARHRPIVAGIRRLG